ncbi:MAG TPA: pseudouridine synthase [Pirellulales bacterium]|nr:pseudouridine synthase [Pirellulales bacterium]
MRLQKLLAAAGIGSRRKCEELITAGRVTVDGRAVTELGTKVDPATADIRVDLEPLPRSHPVYYMVNKPIGVVTTNRDPDGRPRVVDLAPQGQRLFAVGRLDVSSEGLILVTNDGELANLLAHPRYGVEKTYQAQVAGVPGPEVLDRLRRGVHLAEGLAHAKRIWIKSQHKQSTTLEMVLDEGKNREVRRLLAQVGHKVLHLRRTALGPLRLGELPPGECRPLRKEEVRALREAAEGQEGARDERRGPRDEGRGARGEGTGVRSQGPKTEEGRARDTANRKGAAAVTEIETLDLEHDRASAATPAKSGTVIGYPTEGGAGRNRGSAAGKAAAKVGAAGRTAKAGGRRKQFRDRQLQRLGKQSRAENRQGKSRGGDGGQAKTQQQGRARSQGQTQRRERRR